MNIGLVDACSWKQLFAAGSTTEVVKKTFVQNVTVTSTAKKLAAPIKFQNAITWQLESNSIVLK